MIFPPGRYVVVEGVEVSVSHVLEISTPFTIVHSRACKLEDNSDGALVALLVGEDARVVTIRSGREKIWKEGKDDSRTGRHHPRS